ATFCELTGLAVAGLAQQEPGLLGRCGTAVRFVAALVGDLSRLGQPLRALLVIGGPLLAVRLLLGNALGERAQFRVECALFAGEPAVQLGMLLQALLGGAQPIAFGAETIATLLFNRVAGGEFILDATQLALCDGEVGGGRLALDAGMLCSQLQVAAFGLGAATPLGSVGDRKSTRLN